MAAVAARIAGPNGPKRTSLMALKIDRSFPAVKSSGPRAADNNPSVRTNLFVTGSSEENASTIELIAPEIVVRIPWRLMLLAMSVPSFRSLLDVDSPNRLKEADASSENLKAAVAIPASGTVMACVRSRPSFFMSRAKLARVALAFSIPSRCLLLPPYLGPRGFQGVGAAVCDPG